VLHRTCQPLTVKLARVQEIVYAYCVGMPALRVHLRHDRLPVLAFAKPAFDQPLHALGAVLGVDATAVFAALRADGPAGTLSALVPAPRADERAAYRSANDRFFVFVNGRVVNSKNITKLVKRFAPCPAVPPFFYNTILLVTHFFYLEIL
jgi:hypothetical protein